MFGDFEARIRSGMRKIGAAFRRGNALSRRSKQLDPLGRRFRIASSF